MANNLLLVDESPLIHRVVELTFEGHDISVYSADDAEEALTLARSMKPDIVIASTLIKHGNGLDFCRELRSDVSLAQTPILLLTGAKENLSVEEAKEAGAVGVLTKPFNPESLLAQVGLALSWTPPSESDERTDAADLDESGPASGISEEENGTEKPEDIVEEPVSSPLEEYPEITASDSEILGEVEDLSDSSDDQKNVSPEEEPCKPGETDVQIISDDLEEEIPDLSGSDLPSPEHELNVENLPEPEDKSTPQEEEEVYRDIDIEDLFDEFDTNVESQTTEASPAEGISTENLDELENAELKNAEEELDLLQAELTADLEEIGRTHFEEDRIREAEEDLASLEAELAIEEESAGGEETPTEILEDAENLDTDQEFTDIEIPMSDQEPGIETDIAEGYLQDEERELRGKLEEIPDASAESSEPEDLLDESEYHGDAGDTSSEADDLAALLDETDFGPELEIPLETPAEEEISEREVPPPEEEFEAVHIESSGHHPLPREETPEENGDELLASELPDGPLPDKNALEPLVEQSLEKAVEAIVPAILRRIESIIVEQLPDVMEKIVLREIEKIKRGE